MTILPSVYFGSIEYWAALVQAGDDAIIDIGENYIKRSERNRTEIMTSNGVMQLSVQLAHANRPRQPMRTMRIDYSKRWQHQHLIAMESAYRSSPYYDYYADRFTPLYEREWKYSLIVDTWKNSFSFHECESFLNWLLNDCRIMLFLIL